MEVGKNKLPVRGEVLGFFALGGTIMVLAGVELATNAGHVYDAIRSRTQPSARKIEHYTAEELGQMTGQRVEARRGDGFDDLALRANPDADISSSGVRMDLRSFLKDELEEQAGRTVLHPHDELCVPRVSHEKPESPIPPSARCEP